ncbi:MAG: hypothetical protein IT193_09330 [Propionibacteriaceae bacterium]|nr:hypothetical protein [Propionibacteriaceae bacterium]
MRQCYAEMRARLDAQDKNLNVAAVIFVAAVGWLVNYLASKGLDSLITTQVALLVPVLALVMSVMLDRHLDLELNIAGIGEYLNRILLPRLESEPGLGDWEHFKSRQLRSRWSAETWAIMLLSNTAALLLLVSIPLGFSITIWATRPDAAGGAIWAFWILTSISGLFTALEIWQFRSVIAAYQRITGPAVDHKAQR